jgi:hypothetical protein
VGIDASYRSTAPSDPAGVSAAELAQFPVVLGLDTFGDLTHDEDDRPLSHAQTIRNVVEQGVLAGQPARTSSASASTTPMTSRCRAPA